ncbi:hypothetical protein F0562_015494 [Nyssa sinensis]|uniref:Uncharacterized protein n=1 Tax=Nyssa sinensis TaxID=561372 RepID=A0A5J4ZHJ6_9ASTE|nr:hypothetical protein F0562_015494 [Nyssa sinensis]
MKGTTMDSHFKNAEYKFIAGEEVIFMEELSARRKVVRKEAVRGSSDSNPPAALTDELSIVIHGDASSNACNGSNSDWLRSIIDDVGMLGNNNLQKPKIQKVPRMLRDIESNKKCFDPLVVSIGPYHHGKLELQFMEKFKILLAQQYAKENEALINDMYENVAEVAGDARKCYAEGSTDAFDEKAFTRMMFLDGCFVLQFIYCIVNEKHADMKMKSHDIAFVRRDLFLLENQLPFEVLKALMSLRFEKGGGQEMINIFIKRSRPDPPQADGGKASLMNLFRKHVGASSRGHPECEDTKFNNQPIHLLEIVQTQLVDVGAFTKGGCYLTGEWCSYRSAMELKKVGIHFRPSKTRRFSDITFEYTGVSSQLTLPPITIDDSTKSMLLNLVAYEACPDTPDDFGVTSFVCFMDSLIDQAEDVKELRSKGILLNFLGSDQQVADLFNEIARDLVPNPHGFVNVKGGIEKHYKNNVKVWMAEWRHTHFSTPWTIIALVAAIVAITLSVLQTVLGAIQTYLTVYPPNK